MQAIAGICGYQEPHHHLIDDRYRVSNQHQAADENGHMAYILCVSAVQTTVAVKGTITCRAHGEGDRDAEPWAVHRTHLHLNSTTCQPENCWKTTSGSSGIISSEELLHCATV